MRLAHLAIEVVTTIIWLPLELMVIATLLRGQYRRFPFILAYVVAEFFAVAAEIPAYWAVYRGVKNATGERSWLWSLDEVILQALLYALVISLIYQAASRLKSRRVVSLGVIGGAIVFAGGSFLIHYSASAVSIGAWLTPWTRDLNVCSALLDLGLWTLLISSKEKDTTLLLISGGLGIRFTGEAIGDSIRQLSFRRRSRFLSLSGSVVVAVVDIFCLFIWWRALRRESAVAVRRSPIKDEQGATASRPAPCAKTDSMIS